MQQRLQVRMQALTLQAAQSRAERGVQRCRYFLHGTCKFRAGILTPRHADAQVYGGQSTMMQILEPMHQLNKALLHPHGSPPSRAWRCGLQRAVNHADLIILEASHPVCNILAASFPSMCVLHMFSNSWGVNIRWYPWIHSKDRTL